MHSKKLDYKEKYLEAYKKNVASVYKDATEDDVIEEIKNNKIVASFFAINPNKQNFYEKTAGDFISTMEGVRNFRILPTSKLYVVDGHIMDRKGLKIYKKEAASTLPPKTIDFSWEYKNMLFYASHKYTEQEGGAQGNQYKDLQHFITHSNYSKMANVFFIAIADGDFYKKNNGIIGVSRIDHLKEMANKENVFACTINEIEKVLDKF